MDEARLIVAAVAIASALWGSFAWWLWRRQVHHDAMTVARQGEQVIELLREIRDELRRVESAGPEGHAPPVDSAPPLRNRPFDEP